jgi:hypothetical protein
MERKHQAGGLADPAGMLDDALRVRQRGIRIAKQP